MSNIYYDSDAKLDLIVNRTVAIVGYGDQGSALALNMRDSGVKHLLVGIKEDGSYHRAMEDGFDVYTIEKACEIADILFLLLSDEDAPAIFEKYVRPGLREGNIICFTSGYNITFQRIVPPPFVDVVMVSPKAIGGIRESYLQGEGAPAFVGVAQDASGQALEYGKALCRAIEATKKGAIEVNFDDETFLDLMTEQGIWPIVYHVFDEAFKLQVAMGHPEEAVLMEEYISRKPMYMLEKAAELGLFKQMCFHSHTGQYGQLSCYELFDTTQIREFLKDRYDRIRSGVFAAEWEKEQKENNFKTLCRLNEKVLGSRLSKAEERLFRRMD